ncbi:MAG: PGPGW domain-containing protein, partial [Aquiluna sp.]
RAKMEKLKKILSNLPHPVRWAVVMVLGFVLLGMGLVMMVTPGPGLLFVFFGLSILALEIKWARELNQQGMQGLERIVVKLKSIFNRKNKDEKN